MGKVGRRGGGKRGGGEGGVEVEGGPRSNSLLIIDWREFGFCQAQYGASVATF